MGCSSGASAAFTMAWFHPEWYHRVISYSGTFVNQQWPFDRANPDGAWDYHEKLIPAAPRPLPHNALVFQADAPNTFFVGSDAGVFMTPDLGSSWINYSRNMPHTMVVDLVYHLGERTLTAATYGRSIWKIKLS